ncbi:Translation elongation factor Tu [Enhygromyxa salina]|uniref:Translation elongation factor Tu n=2 Tax=Enhygromyxa salina TaxID=215803 RepID=A0A0C1ZVW7_9BACT|nr:Translation elongation factor Tu [Enhygromyxa salina]
MISVGPSAESLGLLSRLLSERFGDRDRRPGSTPDGASGDQPRLEPNQRSYNVDGVRVSHRDLPATSFPGAALVCGDGGWGWVVVLPFEFLRGQATGSLLRLLRSLGERPLAVVIDDPRSDHDAGELRTELVSAGFPAALTPIVWGSLREAVADPDALATSDLLRPFVAWIVESASRPGRDLRTEPFFLSIEDRFNMPRDQLIVTGRIERGTVRTGDTLTLHGSPTTTKRVLGIEVFRRRLVEAEAGDVVGLLLENTRFAEVKRGDLLTALRTPGELRRRVRAAVHLQAREVCGYHGSFDGAVFTLHLRTAIHRATMRLAADHACGWDLEIDHDRTLVVDLELEEPCWYEPGARFGLRIGGKGAGFGVLLGDPP